MSRRAVSRTPFTAAVCAATLATGCLDDLPEATTCPPPPQHTASDCSDALASVAARGMPGCFKDEEMTCLAGPRECTCLAGSCPASETACYPQPDCPAAVREKGHPEARCERLDPSEIGAGVGSDAQCLCGCSGCAAVCDGSGPVLGVLDTGMGVYFPPVFEIGDRMPDAGTLGVYLRVRGLANMSLAVLKGDLHDFENVEFLRGYYVLTPLGTDFVEHVVYDQPFVGMSAYSWSKPEDKPTLLALTLEATAEEPGLALYELDCLVPFVVSE